MNDNLIIKGARQHNLKNVNLKLPRNKFIVFTGLSGSGKSSLAFDTIYAEGQRRYVESLSAYARQFLGQMDKPDVDYIEGLSPAISIDQKTTSRNPRSTVGTVTEIYDYLRLLFARVGVAHCPHCDSLVEKQAPEQIIDKIMQAPIGSKVLILAPIIRGKRGGQQKVLESLRQAGFVRVKVDGEIQLLEEEINLDKNKKHNIAIVIDRLVMREDLTSRIAESVELALKQAEGLVEVEVDGVSTLYSEKLACLNCQTSVEDLEPRSFSFNSPYGACPACTGLGVTMEFDLKLIIPKPDLAINLGGIDAIGSNVNSYMMKKVQAVLERYGYSLDNCWAELSAKVQEKLLYGLDEEKVSFFYTNLQGETKEHNTYYEGILPLLSRRYREASETSKQEIEELYMNTSDCTVCKGARLKPEVLAVRVAEKNIHQVTQLNITEALEFFRDLQLPARSLKIAEQILKEIISRLEFLNNVGLNYLTLARAAGTLSGGEAQRIRLATQIGSGLVGVLYILDEPSIGLHQRDNEKLLQTLQYLRDIGNTLIVVEHDEDTMRVADWIVDIGPRAGVHGGEIVAQGKIADICACPESITGEYLSGKRKIAVPKQRRQLGERFLTIQGAQANNLKNIDVKIPLGIFTVITGVSGSGKSTLINDILYNALAHKLHASKTRAVGYKDILGLEHLDKVINIDQSPIGRTPRSNSATYTGVFDYIRELFSQTTEAKMRNYKAGRFSFNVKGGRCEACQGDGMNKIEMNFLPDVYIPCEVCKAKRYNRETLEVHYKGKNISDVLEMVVDEAVEFFQNIPRIQRKLAVLQEVGLGYIRLGQAATTLSGGEAQRVKLATELSRRSTGKTLYILDEPTTGLHIADIHKLLEVLQKLVAAGDSVLVIEHNLDVIKTADYIIDLGPEGGSGGGEIVACGTPEIVAANPRSYTGKFLQPLLKNK